MSFREAIESDAEDLLALHAHASIPSRLREQLGALRNDYLAQERTLEGAARELRAAWLALAHRPADSTPKSPVDGETADMPRTGPLQFGYERDLDVSLLEERGPAYAPCPAGWSGDMVAFRSGQAALATILQFVAGRFGEQRPLSVVHAGAYFETKALLDAWPRRSFRQAPPTAVSADVVVAEPVWCNGHFGIARDLPRARHALLLDTTMTGPSHDLHPALATAGDDCELAIVFSSGLKLDQAGLELANLGLARILVRGGNRRVLPDTTARLKELRGLMATGLTLDELAALSAPWVLDRSYVDRYCSAIFAHNRALAGAIGGDAPLFGPRSHPSLEEPLAEAPFCAIQLRDPTPARYRRLAEIVSGECDRRGVLLGQGGSFGFRGHRFELIEPAPSQGDAFLRVAMGWRSGLSCSSIVELFGELAACPSFAALDRNYGR